MQPLPICYSYKKNPNQLKIYQDDDAQWIEIEIRYFFKLWSCSCHAFPNFEFWNCQNVLSKWVLFFVFNLIWGTSIFTWKLLQFLVLQFRFSKKATKVWKISHLIWRLLKVRQSRKQIMVLSILPKNERIALSRFTDL